MKRFSRPFFLVRIPYFAGCACGAETGGAAFCTGAGAVVGAAGTAGAADLSATGLEAPSISEEPLWIEA